MSENSSFHQVTIYTDSKASMREISTSIRSQDTRGKITVKS
ncbi:hypothetical protein IC006_0499 [Sulfuracidifex tepidarius]|uniref:Uncharacterized protein n=1 Tax=Sulfuracidifex tepidarius TaxID=1294262 RepID=A0A510DSV7_9CREN|nr:hypothetical protein IC006_0499 [Sulfuracidifex tepidarius]